jgi:hypothetical protein
MKPRSTLTAIAVLCLLGLIASLITVPHDSTQAWPRGRQLVIVDDGGTAATPAAKGSGLISLTKRTIANVEDITEAVKAGMSAAGKCIDKTEKARGETPQAAKDAVLEAVGATPPIPDVPPLPPAAAVGTQSQTITYQRQCGPGGCQLVPVTTPAAVQSPGDQTVESATYEEQTFYTAPVRRGLFGRRR